MSTNAASSGRPIRLSSVVLSWNSSRYLEACIASLVAEAQGHHDEIWVVDNGSTDGSVELLHRLARRWPDILSVIYLAQNMGTTVSRNMALMRARGEYIAIIDSDVTVPTGTIATLIESAAGDPRCGLIVPRLVYPGGRAQMSTDVFPTLTRKLQRLLALRSLERNLADVSPYEAAPVDYAISAFWLLRRDVLNRVGLLDEKIFYSPEDVDYCIRVWRNGYKVIYEPNAHSIHDAQEISRGLRVTRATASHVKGLLYLFWKHRYLLSRERLYERIGRRRVSEPATA